MARTDANETDSLYYPPRARWYSPVFYWSNALRRRLWLDRIQVQLPGRMTFAGSAASSLVPGLGFYLREPRRWALAAWLGYGLMLALFLVAYGYPAGNFALGLLIAIHVTGFLYYCGPFWQQANLQSRLFFALLALLAIGLSVYLPLRNAVLQHWWVPLRLQGRVFVVQRRFPAEAVQRGDWIAYRLGNGRSEWGGGWEHGAVYARSGLGLGPVLAVTGDRVAFSTNAFTVNGLPQAPRPHMPPAGELIVPKNNWFIWPDVGISGHGRTAEANISGAMMQLAIVTREQFVGKVYTRWLGRRQITP
ncbi:MAG TPA: hypothetical protein VMB80_05385 [Candidatus Acidoferrum sp.]|nr:hypothetical protein [Candidatus Acidoferrum sp.]